MNQPNDPAADGLGHDGLAALVQAFYGRVRSDSLLGAVFNSAIRANEWPDHLHAALQA